MSLSAWIAFTLFFGAAWNDADEKQRVALLRAFQDHKESIRHFDRRVWTEGVKSFLTSVQGIMGAHWSPQDEWRDYITRLINEE